MRRKDREIKEKNEIEEILNNGFVCHLALSQDNMPYVLPMLYGYEDDCLYFHCAQVGKKLEMLKENPNVCFEIETTNRDIVENGGNPCDWGLNFKSVIGFGEAHILEIYDEKIKGYNVLVKKIAPPNYVHSDDLYIEKKVAGTVIIKVEIKSITGKKWDGIKISK